MPWPYLACSPFSKLAILRQSEAIQRIRSSVSSTAEHASKRHPVLGASSSCLCTDCQAHTAHTNVHTGAKHAYVEIQVDDEPCYMVDLVLVNCFLSLHHWEEKAPRRDYFLEFMGPSLLQQQVCALWSLAVVQKQLVLALPI